MIVHQSEKAKMLTGELYRATDPELVAERHRAQRLLARFNATGIDDADGRRALLRELFGAIGRANSNPEFRNRRPKGWVAA